MLKVYDFTEPQLAYYRKFCNFDYQEAQLFELRSKNVPLEKCAEIMCCDGIKRISVRVNNKIIKMTDVAKMNKWIEKVYWNTVLK